MNTRSRRPLVPLLLGLSLVAAVSIPAQAPPAFLDKWGSQGASNGQFAKPSGVAVDAAGNVYVADTNNHRIQKFDSTGAFQTVWGSFGSGDVQFDTPWAVAVDVAGNIYVTEFDNHRVQVLNSSGSLVRMWGWGVQDGSSALQVCASGCQAGIGGDGTGQFDNPTGVELDVGGNVYIVDYNNHRIQVFDGNGTFLKTWGWGVQDGSSGFQICTSGCQAGSAGTGDGQFSYPLGVAIGPSGVIHVADTYNHRIQKFDAAGTFLIKWGGFGTGDSQFDAATGVAVDASGHVYVTDFHNHRAQKFDRDGTFLTKWGTSGSADGQFNNPYDLAIDGQGYVYVADSFNHRIQKFGGPWLDLFIGEPELPRDP